MTEDSIHIVSFKEKLVYQRGIATLTREFGVLYKGTFKLDYKQFYFLKMKEVEYMKETGRMRVKDVTHPVSPLRLQISYN